MIYANNVRINVRHALRMLLNAQLVIQIDYFKLINVTAYQAFMTHLVDVRDVPINVLLVKILQHNA